MKIIKAIIIDDEIKATENLEFLLQTYCKEIEVIATFNHPFNALESIKTLKPDLLLLDIEMPQFDGFQLLEMINHYINPKVIFTTAYKDYALEALKKSASDYLLKPININELIKAILKITNEINKEIFIEVEKPLHIKITSVSGFDLLKISDINYLKSTNNSTEIFYSLNGVEKKIVATKPIKHFEETLQGYSFFRIHDSFIINLNNIKQYIKGVGGYVILHDGTEINVSRRRKQDFLNLFLN